MQIAKNTVAQIEYTLYAPDGKVIDSSKGKAPLAYLHGVGQIIPGLEAALDGKSPGESLTVAVPSDQAYGQKNPQLVQSVPRTNFKGVANIQPGMQFEASTPQGKRVVTVTRVDANEVTVDANHPLAGIDLKFDIKIVGVRLATQQDLDHGHAHGEGGHHHH
jgi:FKBP-type peptidyl-prolyl cis-trans isomerase SlyD